MACTYSLSYNGVQGLFSKKTPIHLFLSRWLGSMTRYVTIWDYPMLYSLGSQAHLYLSDYTLAELQSS